MNIQLDELELSEHEKEKITKLLNVPQENRSDIEQIWYLMDLVWDDLQCDNINYNSHSIEKFYSHPIWLLNGLFIEQHNLSMQHREAISDWIIHNGFKKIIDYGGGYGTLARLIAKKSNKVEVDIFEPHPHENAVKKAREFKNIFFINELKNKYDCLISTDVLEHVPNPLKILHTMISCVHVGGYLVIANNFSPSIKCHLPCTFHLWLTFNFFTVIMGIKKIGPLNGSHVTIYRKNAHKQFNWKVISILEYFSRVLFLLVIRIYPIIIRKNK